MRRWSTLLTGHLALMALAVGPAPAADPSVPSANPLYANEPRQFDEPVADEPQLEKIPNRQGLVPRRPAPPAAIDKPVADKSAVEADEAADGPALVRRAFDLSKTAKTKAAYAQVIELCERGSATGLTGAMIEYGSQLQAWAHNRRGELEADAQHDREALTDFEAAVKLDATKWRHLHNRGVSYATLGKYDAALGDFDEAIRLNPNYANAYFNRGELRYEAGDFQAAIQDYDQAIRRSPRDAAAYNSRGHAHYRLQQFREALADYNRAVQLDPQNAAALTNRGDAYADLGQWPEASRDYRAAIKFNPKLGRAFQSAAWMMSTCPDPEFRNSDLCIDAANKAIELDGEGDYRYLETLAAAFANAGDYNAAVTTQKKVAERAPQAQQARVASMLEQYEQRKPYREPPREAAPAADGQARRPGRS